MKLLALICAAAAAVGAAWAAATWYRCPDFETGDSSWIDALDTGEFFERVGPDGSFR